MRPQRRKTWRQSIVTFTPTMLLTKLPFVRRAEFKGLGETHGFCRLIAMLLVTAGSTQAMEVAYPTL
jgi:hypothetical protein